MSTLWFVSIQRRLIKSDTPEKKQVTSHCVS